MAPDVYFTSNEADIEQLEGLYVIERDPQGFIRGRDLSAVGMAGVTVRGPTTIQTITDAARFLEIYGDRDYGDGGPIVSEIWRALRNKRFGTLYIQRVVASDAVAGTVNLADVVPTDIVQVDASSAGEWSLAANSGPTVSVEDAADEDADHFNLRVTYQGQETVYRNLDVTAGNNNLAEVIGDDPATLITVTKLADGRPLNIADEALAGGDDGTLVAADYNTAIDLLAAVQGPSVVLLAGESVDQSSLNGTIVTQAAAVNDRIFLTWSGVDSQAPAAEIASLAADITTRSDRIVWCYNGGYTLDRTGLEMFSGPHEWMASVLSQNDVDIHPGSQRTARQTAAIRRLEQTTLSRASLISLRDAGICALERLPDGFVFRSGKTTSLVAGRTEITRRRSADFLLLSAADRLRFYVKEKNLVETRIQLIGEVIAFSQSLQDQQRIVESFSVVSSGNTQATRARGVERLLWEVNLINHILHLVVDATIANGIIEFSEGE
jgi:hypothetical protein